MVSGTVMAMTACRLCSWDSRGGYVAAKVGGMVIAGCSAVLALT